MSYPGMDYNKLALQSAPAGQQFSQGIDPDWTQLAQAYGFRPNPFPAAGTEGQDQMRFLATLKNIADAQLGGAGGRYAQMSPSNPTAAMPFGMNQWMQGLSPLFNSPQGRNLLPANQADMFGGGYQFGGIDTSQQSGLMALLASARSGQPVGQTPITNAPAPTASNTAATTPADSTQAAAAQVSGGNDTTNNPPANASAANTVQSTTSGQQDILSALKQADATNPAGGVGGAQYGPSKDIPAPLQQAWNSFMISRNKNAGDSASKELDFWTNPVFQQFATWAAQHTTGAQGNK